MIIKTQWQTIDKDRCYTFFAEDADTNTCIYSGTYICNKEGKKAYPRLKAEFTAQIMELQIKEKLLINAEIHKLNENKIPLDLDGFISFDTTISGENIDLKK